MPVYAFECPECGCGIETFRKVEYRNCETLCKCGSVMNRAIERPNVNPDYEPYLDENIVPMGAVGGIWVRSRQHRRQLLRENGLGEMG